MSDNVGNLLESIGAAKRNELHETVRPSFSERSSTTLLRRTHYSSSWWFDIYHSRALFVARGGILIRKTLTSQIRWFGQFLKKFTIICTHELQSSLRSESEAERSQTECNVFITWPDRSLCACKFVCLCVTERVQSLHVLHVFFPHAALPIADRRDEEAACAR